MLRFTQGDDVDATIAELGKVLDQAGMQDIIKELEKPAFLQPQLQLLSAPKFVSSIILYWSLPTASQCLPSIPSIAKSYTAGLV